MSIYRTGSCASMLTLINLKSTNWCHSCLDEEAKRLIFVQNHHFNIFYGSAWSALSNFRWNSILILGSRHNRTQWLRLRLQSNDPLVRIPSTTATFFSIHKVVVDTICTQLLLECEKNENKQKEAGSDPFKNKAFMFGLSSECLFCLILRFGGQYK